jgi:cell division transport system permease protein
MRAIEYALREGWASLWRTRGSSAFAVVAIALATLVLGTLLLLTWNVEQLLTRWTSAAEFSVYLRDDATSEQRGALEVLIDRSGATAGREYVSKGDALTRFRREFTELASLTEGFDDNPFPASVEVRLLPDAEADGRAEALVRQVAALPGVADVRYDREWLARIASCLAAVRGVGLALGVLMAVAAAITVAAVVRLGLHARRDEIEIMQLVGSPMAFIRGPFVAEGLMQGGFGALVALAFLWLGFGAVAAWWGSELGALLDGSAVQFLPARLCAYLVAGGMAVGGRAALRRRATPFDTRLDCSLD